MLARFSLQSRDLSHMYAVFRMHSGKLKGDSSFAYCQYTVFQKTGNKLLQRLCPVLRGGRESRNRELLNETVEPTQDVQPRHYLSLSQLTFNRQVAAAAAAACPAFCQSILSFDRRSQWILEHFRRHEGSIRCSLRSICPVTSAANQYH